MNLQEIFQERANELVRLDAARARRLREVKQFIFKMLFGVSLCFYLLYIFFCIDCDIGQIFCNNDNDPRIVMHQLLWPGRDYWGRSAEEIESYTEFLNELSTF